MSDHVRSEACTIQFGQIENRLASIEGGVGTLKGSYERVNRGHDDLLERVEIGHRRVDRIEVTMNNIDKSLAALLAVRERETASQDKKEEAFSEFMDDVKALRSMVENHENYIKEKKQSKRDLVLMIGGPIVAAVLGFIGGHFK